MQGFFQNGGQVCYVTAVSNASPDHGDLFDQATPTAREDDHGDGAAKRHLESSNQSFGGGLEFSQGYDAEAASNGVRLFAPTVAGVTVAAANRAKVRLPSDSDAAQFLAGDRLKIDGGGQTEFPTVNTASGKDVFLAAELTNTYTNATVTLAPLDPFATSFRVFGRHADGSGLRAAS